MQIFKTILQYGLFAIVVCYSKVSIGPLEFQGILYSPPVQHKEVPVFIQPDPNLERRA